MLTSKITHRGSCVGAMGVLPTLSARQCGQGQRGELGQRGQVRTHELELFLRYVMKKANTPEWITKQQH